MKHLLRLLLAIGIWQSAIGNSLAAVAANDLILTQRNAANDNNTARYVPAVANGLLTFTSSVPATITSSAGLRGAISDESGTGALVFADTPTLVTPVLGAATGTSLALSATGTFGGLVSTSATFASGRAFQATTPSGNTVGLRLLQSSVSDWMVQTTATTGAFEIVDSGTPRVTVTGTATTIAGNLIIASTSAIAGVRTATAALDFPSTIAGAVADLTITVTGAAVGDTVAIGVPNGSVTATAVFFGWVSATNTVTIRFSPKATEDPASNTFRATVTSF